MDLDPQAVERAVREHEDPYPFAIEMLGAVFRGAIAAGAMGTDESDSFVEMDSFCASHIGNLDAASLHLYTGGQQ